MFIGKEAGTTAPTPKVKRPRWVRYGRALLFVASFFGGYLGILQASGNFHTVQSGVVYRAAQPSKSQIADYQKEYGIKTIVNLRGPNKGTPWYDDEVAAAQALGIRHIDFAMSARKRLSQERAEQLVAILRDAPKPVLIHCNAGADRSGLASALYLAAIAKRGELAAETQLSFIYGHIGLPYVSSAYAMDDSFENLEIWLGFPGS